MCSRSLADVVLGASRHDDGSDLEDEDLRRELDQLRRQRRLKNQSAVLVLEANGGADDEAANPLVSGAGAEASSASDKNANAMEDTSAVTVLGGEHVAAPRSLADEILARSANADREMEEMERELERQMSELRSVRDPHKGATATAPPMLLSKEQPSQQGMQPPLHTSLKHSIGTLQEDMRRTASACASDGGIPDGGWRTTASLKEAMATNRSNDDECRFPPELFELHDEVAKMEAIFPERPDDGGKAEGQKSMISKPRSRARTFCGQRTREFSLEDKGPADESSRELRAALDDLDTRLRAIQQQEEMYADPCKAPELEEVSSSVRVVRDIRGQNEHLRECLKKSGGGRGLLCLDRNLFATVVTSTSAMHSSTLTTPVGAHGVALETIEDAMN